MADPIIGSAFVNIRPEPASVKAFGPDVRKSIQTQLAKTPIKIAVTPDISGPWKRRIQTELKTAKLVVPVTPVIDAKGRAALRKQLAALASIPVPVAVLPGAATAGAAAGAGGPAALGFSQSELAKTGVAAGDAQAFLNKQLAQGAIIIPEVVASTEALNSAQGRGAGTAAAKSAADQRAAATAQAALVANRTGLAIEERLAKVSEVTRFATTEAAKAKALHAEFTELQTLSSTAYQAALESEDANLIQATASLKAKITAEVENTATTYESAAANNTAAASARKRAGAEALAARGAGATGLAALGARGATLAASGEFLVGAAAATAFFKSVSLAAEVEQELNVFKQTAAATADEMERVSATARELGADITLPGVSAGDAAEAMTELAKAGLSVDDSIAAARGTLQLATAAQLDNAEATNITASALNAFGLEGSEALHVADLLAGAANAAQGGIDQMGASLSSVASVARQAGLSVEDTVAMITLLAKNGVQGAEGGTALRVALLRLIAPTDKARKTLKDLNVQILDAQGNVRPEVFADIADAVNELGPSQRNAALQTIFGTRAIRAQAILGRENVAGLNEMRQATDQAGLAAQLAGARTAGFTGKIEALKSSLETLGAEFGALTLGPLGTFIDLIAVGTETLTDFTTLLGKVGDVEIPFTGNAAERSATTAGDVFGTVFKEVVANTLSNITLGPGITAVIQGRRVFNALKGDTVEVSDEVLKLSQRLEDTGGVTDDLAHLIGGLFREFEASAKTTTNLHNLLIGLKAIADSLRDGTPEARKLAAEIDEIVAQVQRLGKLPPVEPKIKMPKVSAAELRQGRQLFIDALTEGLSPQVADALGFNFMEQLGRGAERGGEIAGDAAGKAFIAGLETQLAVAEAVGTRAGQLSILRQMEANALAHLNRMQALFKAKGGAGREEAVANAAARLANIRRQIEGITGEIESESKAAADAVIEARNKADQNFLDALALDQTKRENAILRAEGTAGVQDDVRTHTILRDFLVRRRDLAAKTLRDAKTKAETVASLTSQIIRENQTIAQLNRELGDSLRERFELRLEFLQATGTIAQVKRLFEKRIAELRKLIQQAKHQERLTKELKLELAKTRQEMREALSEGFELDIEFAETTENERAEVAARRRYIRFLEEQQSHVKRGTLEWKRLRNLIAEQRQAIKDTKDEAEATFHEMAFEFLTRQQGFAANVMSNLLPISALPSGGPKFPGTGGAAGIGTSGAGGAGIDLGGAQGFGGVLGIDFTQENMRAGRKGRPTQGLEDRAAAAAAGEKGGSPAQFATIIHLLTQMVRLLGGMEGRSKHPEAKRRERQGGGRQDTM